MDFDIHIASKMRLKKLKDREHAVAQALLMLSDALGQVDWSITEVKEVDPR